VAYWFSDEGGTYREILALGNPLVWWPGLVALGGLLVTWWRSGWRVLRPEPVVLGAAAATYLPWLILSGDRSQTFIWYFLPTVPFLCVAIGCFAGWAWSSMAGRVATVAYGALVVASFAFYLPVLTALPLDQGAWRTRILFADCAGSGTADPSVPDDSTSQGDPPRGWCWI
jgi:dolichyl-phosphate-mannose-protein mannosyltransferase